MVIDCSREMFEKTRGEIPFQLCIKVRNNSLLVFFLFFYFIFGIITVYCDHLLHPHGFCVVKMNFSERES